MTDNQKKKKNELVWETWESLKEKIKHLQNPVREVQIYGSPSPVNSIPTSDNALLDYQQENKELREEIVELKDKEKELSAKQNELKNRLSVFEREEDSQRLNELQVGYATQYQSLEGKFIRLEKKLEKVREYLAIGEVDRLKRLYKKGAI